MQGTDDPVAEFLGRSFADEHQKLWAEDPKAESAVAERSLVGLRSLAGRYEWGAVLELSTALLADDDDAEAAGGLKRVLLPTERLLCMAYRGFAFLQTGQLDKAIQVVGECRAAVMGDSAEGSGKYKKEDFPFELQMLAAEVRIRKGDFEAIGECYKLKAKCGSGSQNPEASTEEKQLWKDREVLLLSAITGYHLRAGHYDAAADSARQLVAQQGHSAEALYLYARVLIHIGDYNFAMEVIREAEQRPEARPEATHLHRGLIYGATGEYEKAISEYDKVRSLTSGRSVAALNNKATCLLNLGKLTEAIEVLEALLRSNLGRALDEGVITNLCTMYDLAYPESAVDKKRVLKKLAERYGRQGFDMSSLAV